MQVLLVAHFIMLFGLLIYHSALFS